jgi:hypothetical protein
MRAGSIGRIGTYTDNDFSIVSNSTDQIRIKSNGNVGIGTTSPSVSLHVKKDSSSLGPILRLDNASTGDLSQSGIQFVNGPTGVPRSAIYSQRVNSAYDAELVFYTSPDDTLKERLRIDHDGHIRQNFINYTDASNYEALKISGESDHVRFDTQSIGSFASNERRIEFHTNGTKKGQITNAGVWTLGSFYISGTGSLRNLSNNLQITTSSQTDNDIIFKPNDTEAVRIFASTLRIRSAEDKTWTVGDKVASLQFFSADQSGSGPNSVRSEINLVTENTFGSAHSLSFATRADVSGSPTEKAKITSSGDMELVTDGKGLILNSPDGTAYKITVANDGTVTSTAV